MEKLTNYVCNRSSILIKKLEDVLETDHSQEFLFQWDAISDQLVNCRGPEPVEHIKIND